jgi:hypothetical protein
MRKQNIIRIIIGLIILIILIELSYWYINKQKIIPTSFIIDSEEKENNNSPFGIFEVMPPDLQYLSDLGVKIVIDSIPPFLSLSESRAFNKWPEFSQRYKEHIKKGIEVMPIIPLTNEEFNKMSLKQYYESVKQLVNYFNKSDYFLLTLEADGMGMGDGATNKKPEKYALFIRLTYKAIKEANPIAKLAAAGTGGDVCTYDINVEPCPVLPGILEDSRPNYFRKVLDELEHLEKIEKNPLLYDWKINKYKLSKGEFNLLFKPDIYKDYMDVHQFSKYVLNAKEYRNNILLYQTIRNVFNEKGYENVELWVTQTGTHSGETTDILISPFQTEKQQAESVVKIYTLALANDIKKIFWQGIEEYEWPDIGACLGCPGNPEQYFSKVPLVYDGKGKNDLGKEVKKLSYYTYKKMVEILDGSDWDNIQTIQENDGVYIYKFTKQNEPIWVAWNDNLETKIISLDVDNINSVKITKAIPHYNTGREVKDYSTAFKTEIMHVNNGKIILTLDEYPIYIVGREKKNRIPSFG